MAACRQPAGPHTRCHWPLSALPMTAWSSLKAAAAPGRTLTCSRPRCRVLNDVNCVPTPAGCMTQACEQLAGHTCAARPAHVTPQGNVPRPALAQCCLRAVNDASYHNASIGARPTQKASAGGCGKAASCCACGVRAHKSTSAPSRMIQPPPVSLAVHCSHISVATCALEQKPAPC